MTPALQAATRRVHRCAPAGWLARALLALVLLLAGSAARAADSDPTLQLGPAAVEHDAWPVARVLIDPAATRRVDEVLQRPQDFAPVGRLGANLGRQPGAAWLRIPLQVPPGSGGAWLLEVDYPPLDHVDVHLVDAGGVRRTLHLGDHVDATARPLPSRSHAALLDLPEGDTLLLLRVQTSGSMLVPVTLSRPAQYQLREAREQALQGLLAGMGLCLLLYSVAQWASLRDPMFGLYALSLLGTTGFFASLSGMGPQHVWGASAWLTQNGAPFWILLGVCGAFFFVLHALQVQQASVAVARLLQGCGLLAGASAALFLLGVLGYGTAQAVGMGLGPAPLLLVLPIAFRRLRDGDRAAAFLLAGWGFYSLGVLVLVALLGGWAPVGFWTLHGFQFASMVEMAMWMLVLGNRVHRIQQRAAAVQTERDLMHSLAHTDVLTGLLNRRGLQQVLPPLVARSGPRSVLALFVLDLDGFKQVNDTLGHDAGDALLVAVAQRLRAQLRARDLVCRLGGDEFVLAVGDLTDDADAERIGRKLLAAFDAPFEVAGQPCRVGLTIGLALAPQDDTTVGGLLKRADAAMYAGKQAGRHCLRRGQASVGLSGA